MKRIVFYLRTHLQLITALNIIDHLRFKQKDISCILSDRLIQNGLKDKIDNLHIFNDIYTLPHKQISIKKWLQSGDLRNQLPIQSTNKYNFSCISNYENFLERHFNIPLRILKEASDIYFHSDLDLISSLCPKSCLRHLIDEGTRSYLEISLQSQPDRIYLYEPKLVVFPTEDLQIIQIPKISKNRKTLLYWISSIFNCKPFFANNIYFDQPLGKRGIWPLSCFSKRTKIEIKKFNARLKIISQLSMKECNIYLRLHPGTTKSQIKYLSKRFKTTESSIPFEVELIYNKTDTYNLFTISSSAACYWLIMFDRNFFSNKKIHTTFYYNKYLELSEDTSSHQLITFFNKLKSIYPIEIM